MSDQIPDNKVEGVVTIDKKPGIITIRTGYGNEPNYPRLSKKFITWDSEGNEELLNPMARLSEDENISKQDYVILEKYKDRLDELCLEYLYLRLIPNWLKIRFKKEKNPEIIKNLEFMSQNLRTKEDILTEFGKLWYKEIGCSKEYETFVDVFGDPE